jgi:DNA-binding beta-propeller fold protein YncE
VITVPLGGITVPTSIAFDEAGQRVFTANSFSNSVSIIEFSTINRICQNSGFDTGDIRTFVSGQQTLEQITCVNFVGQCSGNVENGETRECTVEDYVVSLDEVSNNDDGIGILSNIDKSQQQNPLYTHDMSNTKNKIKTQALPTGPFIYEIPKH